MSTILLLSRRYQYFRHYSALFLLALYCCCMSKTSAEPTRQFFDSCNGPDQCKEPFVCRPLTYKLPIPLVNRCYWKAILPQPVATPVPTPINPTTATPTVAAPGPSPTPLKAIFTTCTNTNECQPPLMCTRFLYFFGLQKRCLYG